MPEIDADEFEDFDVEATPDVLAAAAAALAGSPDTAKQPDLDLPLDGPVTLPAGYRRLKPGTTTPEFETVTKAWVKELDGFAEERISKARMKGDDPAVVEEILLGGVERLGDREPTRDDFRALVSGDIEFLLLEISRATYGDEIEYDDFQCPNCLEAVSFTVHKGEDIPVKHLDSPDEVDFEFDMGRGKSATVRLPTGEDQLGIKDSMSPAEVNTHLLAACVSEVRGPRGVKTIAGDVDAARSLSTMDRQTLITEMSKRMPGPQYNEVRFTHPECGKEIRLTVTFAELFREM